MPNIPFNARNLLWKPRRAKITTAALPISIAASSCPSADHGSLCLSLADRLIRRGLLSPAQGVVRRIIEKRSSSVYDAISAVGYVHERGMDLDPVGFSALVRKLVGCGEDRLAEWFFVDRISREGIDVGRSTLNYMITCYCHLGKIEEAVDLFNRIVKLDSFPSAAACYAITRDFCHREMVSEAFHVFLNMCDTGMDISIWIYNMLAEKLCRKGYLDEAYQVLSLMHTRSRISPTLHQYKTLFCGLCRAGRTADAELLSCEMESLGLYIDRVMYTQLIHGYVMVRKMKMAMQVFYKMLKMGCEADTWTYNTIIHGFSKLGLYDKACFMHNRMVDMGMEPGATTYHILISSWCKNGNADCALRLLNDIWSKNIVPSVRSYTVLVSALYKENRFEEADDLCSKMLDDGVLPDHLFYFVTMRNQQKGAELELAFLMLEAIAINGCHLQNDQLSDIWKFDVTVDIEKNIQYLLGEIAKKDILSAGVAYDIFIIAFCYGDNLDSALVLLQQMLNFGCFPVLFTYNSIIRCLCRKGLFEDAESLINLLHDKGPTPDLDTYLVMIHEHCRQGHVESALDAFDRVVQGQMKPNVAIYDTIIATLGRERRFFEAEDMFERMHQAGVDPDETIYRTMINLYCKSGRPGKALELFERLVESSVRPSSYTYTAIISGLVNNDKIQKGCHYLDKMINDGLEPNYVLYTSLIRYFLKRGDFRFAFELVATMDMNQIESDLLTRVVILSGVCRHICRWKRRWGIMRPSAERAQKTLLCLLRRKFLAQGTSCLRIPGNSPEGMKKVAVKLLQQSVERKFAPNLYLYNTHIYGFCRAKMMKDAYEQLILMRSEGLHPNQVTFTTLIGGHIMLGEIDRAINLFNMMGAEGYLPDEIASNTLLRGLSASERLLEALSVVFMMYKRGFIPSSASFRNLLYQFCACDWSMEAFKIFKEMISHDLAVSRYRCNRLLSKLCESDNLDEAKEVYKFMVDRGIL